MDQKRKFRRLFKKYRETKIFDKHLYSQLYFLNEDAKYNSKRKL